MQSLLTPSALLTATAGLMAFQLGLYTLVGRERKSPYTINSVFWLFLLCLVAVMLDVTAALVPQAFEIGFLYAGAIALLVAVAATAHAVFRMALRIVYFVDDPRPRHWPLIRHLRAFRERSKRGPSYSHDALPINERLTEKIEQVLRSKGNFEQRRELGLRSLVLAVQHQGQGNEILAQLAQLFLVSGFTVQYLTASRHPIEFVEALKTGPLAKDWQQCRSRIVVVDAFTPHFGFIDSIYREKARELEDMGVQCIMSRRTFAGIHTATSKAFNRIKKIVKAEDTEDRKPTLVIYEETYALADLESPEQYRIFVRHVLPSERMWQGMFTVFVESAQAAMDWQVLQSYASMTLDLRTSRDVCPTSKAQ